MADSIAFSSDDLGGGFITSVDPTLLQVVSGQLQITAIDLGLALGSTYDSATLQIVGGKLKINPATGATGTGIDLGKAITATVGTALSVVSGVLGVPASAITATLIANSAVGDTKFDRATGNKIAIVNADIVSLFAAKITAGTLVSGVILSSSIAATQILAGTLAAGVIYAGTVAVGQLVAGTAAFASTATFGAGSNSLQIGSTSISIVTSSTSCVISASSLALTAGSNSCTVSASSLIIAAGSTNCTITSSSITLNAAGAASITISTGGTITCSGGSGSTIINGNTIACLTISVLQVLINAGGVVKVNGTQVVAGRQAGPGAPGSYAGGALLSDLGQSLALAGGGSITMANLYNFLTTFWGSLSAAGGGHGLIN